MLTTTKREMIDRIATATGFSRGIVKRIIQEFLDQTVIELSEGRRIEFRDFGVFEVRQRAARTAQNPRTLERVTVEARRTAKFKPGRFIKKGLLNPEEIRSLLETAQHDDEDLVETRKNAGRRRGKSAA